MLDYLPDMTHMNELNRLRLASLLVLFDSEQWAWYQLPNGGESPFNVQAV